jgi:DNA-binding protein Fis
MSRPVTTEQAEKLTARLIDAFPQTSLRDTTRGTYEKYFRDLDFAAASDAVDLAIATEVELPTIGQIRRTVIGRRLALPSALEAYSSVVDPDKETDPLARRVANLFGGTFNIKNADNPGVIRSQFMKTYDEFREDELREANLASLRGRRAR